MRFLGIDYGTKLMGISVSDETNTIASALMVIEYKTLGEVINKLKDIVKEYNITKIVMGNPLNMSGEVSKRSEEVFRFKELIEKELMLEVLLVDERLTSVVANNLLIGNNTSRRKRKKIVDKISASIILQSYLDRSNYGK